MDSDCCFVDTSVIVSIAIDEAHADKLVAFMERSRRLAVGAPSLVEVAMVLGPRFGHDPRPWLETFLRRTRFEVIPFGFEHYQLATEAFLLYGKGRHPAKLNFGDCLTYAGAMMLGWPLLYIGNDFSQTDVVSALT